MKPYNKANVSIAKVLRKNVTLWERKLWYEFLKDYPVRFQRQKMIGRYIVDFFCASAGIIIELDGSQHYEADAIKRDEERTKYLSSYNLDVIRIPNNQIDQNFKLVCEYIDSIVQKKRNISSICPSAAPSGRELSATLCKSGDD